MPLHGIITFLAHAGALALSNIFVNVCIPGAVGTGLKCNLHMNLFIYIANTAPTDCNEVLGGAALWCRGSQPQLAAAAQLLLLAAARVKARMRMDGLY